MGQVVVIPLPIWVARGEMDRDRFETLVIRAVSELPSEFQSRLANVDVVVEDWPTARQLGQAGVGSRTRLLGLYQGVPQTRRSQGYDMVLPDKITIFRKPIERLCRSPEEVQRRIGEVVRHEIAHHFGTDEKTLRRIEGRRRRKGE